MEFSRESQIGSILYPSQTRNGKAPVALRLDENYSKLHDFEAIHDEYHSIFEQTGEFVFALSTLINELIRGNLVTLLLVIVPGTLSIIQMNNLKLQVAVTYMNVTWPRVAYLRQRIMLLKSIITGSMKYNCYLSSLSWTNSPVPD